MSYLYRRFRRGTVLAVWLLGVTMLQPPAVVSQDQEDEVEVAIPRYSLGDNTLSMRVGVGMPLLLLASAEVETHQGDRQHVLPPNLSLMGTAAVNWNAYLDPSFTIGMEVSGALAIDINDALLYLVPILARGGYVISTPQMEIPLMLGLGAVVMRLVDKTSVGFTLQPGASFLWRATSDWSFGVTAEYWFTWEPRWGEGNTTPHLFGNFITATASAVYHF